MTIHYSILKTAMHVSAVLLLSGTVSQVVADSTSRGLSYSPDNWPNRWSSAIRQQQNGNYPTRQLKQAPPPDLPQHSSGVSEQDLFYSPSMQGRFGQRQDDRLQRFEEPLPHYRQFRDAKREPRRGTFAYHGMPALQQGNHSMPYTSFPYGTAPLGIDPVLGHPGIGIPIMPGTPYGYPFVGYPHAGYPYGGYPGGMGMWNPPFGAW